MQPHSISGQSLSGHATRAVARQLAPAAYAILLGMMLVLLVGFAPIGEVHNAAHDTRHSAAFPCH